VDYRLFTTLLGAEPAVAKMAQMATLACIPLPAINALMCYYRGVLTSLHLTGARMVAIFVSVSMMASMLFIGLALHWPALIMSAAAVTASSTSEFLVLFVFLKVQRKRLEAKLA